MVELVDELGERRNVVVALDHGRHRSEIGDRVAVEIPHLVTDRMVMRIDEMRLFMAMAGHMELHHAIARHAVEEIVSRETVN